MGGLGESHSAYSIRCSNPSTPETVALKRNESPPIFSAESATCTFADETVTASGTLSWRASALEPAARYVTVATASCVPAAMPAAGEIFQLVSVPSGATAEFPFATTNASESTVTDSMATSALLVFTSSMAGPPQADRLPSA